MGHSLKARVGALLALMRVSNSLTIITNVVAGSALGGLAIIGQGPWIIVSAMLLLYWAGMILNDFFDYQVDCRERPDRPLPSGLISRTSALSWVFLMTAGAFSLLAWRFLPHQPIVLVCAVFLLGFILLYDVWHKQNPISSLIMSACRVMVYVVTYVSISGTWYDPLYLPMSAVVIYVTGITLLARNEATNAPRRWPLLMIFYPVLLPLILWAAPSRFVLQTPTLIATVPAVLIFVGWTLHALRPAFRTQNPQVGQSIGRLVAGICVLDLVIIASQASPEFYLNMEELIGMVICVMMLVITNILQRNIKGH